MPDVEFLVGDASGDGEEFLDTRPGPPVPRWVLLVGVLAVVGLIVTVIVRHGGGTPVAQPAPIPPTPSSATPSVVQIEPNLPVPNTYALVGDERDHELFAVSGARLFAFREDGLPVGNSVPVQLGLGLDTQTELLLDGADHVLWAVPQNTTGSAAQPSGLVQAFDTRTLHSLGRSAMSGRIESAAVLGPSLFVTTTIGLFRLPGPGTPPEALFGRQAANDQLVADPTRDRLIAVDTATYTSRFLHLGRSLSAPIRLTHGVQSLAVVGSTIWASSLGAGRPELAVLDPATLRPARNIADGVDVTIAGTGLRSLYVTAGNRLHCLDASTGRTLHDFGRVHGDFATVAGRGFVGTISALHPIAMGRCPG